MMIETIKKIINEWDPIELLDFVPMDEYDVECSMISENFSDCYYTLGIVIYNVFSERFGEEFRSSLDECIEIARKIVGDSSHS